MVALSARSLVQSLPLPKFLTPTPTPTNTRKSSSDARAHVRYEPLEVANEESGLPSPSIHKKGHKRSSSLSPIRSRRAYWGVGAGVVVAVLCLVVITRQDAHGFPYRHSSPDLEDLHLPISENGPIPLGTSVERGGREVFWWEQFTHLKGFWLGHGHVVTEEAWTSEQTATRNGYGQAMPRPTGYAEPEVVGEVPKGVKKCRGFESPEIKAYRGKPQGQPAPLFGSLAEVGIDEFLCYDRVNRYAPYGLTFYKEDGGFSISTGGDRDDLETITLPDYTNVNWNTIQNDCVEDNKEYLSTQPRTAFILRTWAGFEYTPHRIVQLRAMINEISLRTGGRVFVHFLIHVQDDTIPIWASEEIYNSTLASALPTEFSGMGTLWSNAQMRLIYPGPFDEAIENFSGQELYAAYRSLHFPLQYFATQHPEFDYYWHWEMDVRVTGHMGELIDKVSDWADVQSTDHLWERSSQYYIPSLYDNSYTAFKTAVREYTASNDITPISGPQLPASSLLPIPTQNHYNTTQPHPADFITFSPLFDPSNTRWAFHNDITGYPPSSRPPTRAALITVSRLSRRLLLLMHSETFRNRHTMFPEMYAPSIALHYGLKAVSVPLPIYHDFAFPPQHADEIFNNAPLSPDTRAAAPWMDHGGGRFHGEGGSVFGPGEHVFRGATWYSNAGFAGDLWRRWLGTQSRDEADWENERDGGNGRMCLPMMLVHPVKEDSRVEEG